MKKIGSAFLSAMFLVVCMVSSVAAADKTPEQMIKEAKAAIKSVSIEEVKKLIDTKAKVVILDVTDRQEFEAGHLPGAINISRGTLEFKAGLTIPDKNARIIVYCGLDLRGPLATKTLIDLGYEKTVDMAGGLKAWKAAGYPLAQ